MIWNRQRYLRDPETGKRVSRPNAPDARMNFPVPTLGIVDERDWKTVQAGLAKHRGGHRGPKAKHLLSGILRCGSCGGSFTAAGGRRGMIRFECSTRRQKGTCDNRRTVVGARVEQSILSALETELLHEDVIAEVVKTYVEARQTEARQTAANHAIAEKRLAEIVRELKRHVAEIGAGNASRAIRERMAELEGEEDRLRPG